MFNNFDHRVVRARVESILVWSSSRGTLPGLVQRLRPHQVCEEKFNITRVYDCRSHGGVCHRTHFN